MDEVYHLLLVFVQHVDVVVQVEEVSRHFVVESSLVRDHLQRVSFLTELKFKLLSHPAVSLVLQQSSLLEGELTQHLIPNELPRQLLQFILYLQFLYHNAGFLLPFLYFQSVRYHHHHDRHNECPPYRHHEDYQSAQDGLRIVISIPNGCNGY